MSSRLITFGSPVLRQAAGGVLGFPEKAILILCYLLTRQQLQVSRTEMARFLWDEEAGVASLVNLRQLLARVKARQRELAVPILAISETSITLNRDAVTSDLDALADAGAMEPSEELEVMLANITGPFLLGISLSSESARMWLDNQRGKFLLRFATVLEQVSTGAECRLHLELVRDAAFRILELDPYHEGAYRALLKAYSAGGDLNQAKLLFERCKTRLWTDLGVDPEGQTLETMRSLFAQGQKGPGAPAGGRSASGAWSAEVRPAQARYVEARSKSAASAEIAPARVMALPRLALLPPTDSGQAHSGILSGLIEDITIGLCGCRSVSVVAAHTSSQIAAARNYAAAYEQHAIAYVLQTQVRREGNTTRVFVTLNDIRADETIWADRMDASLLRLQDCYRDISGRIVATITSEIARAQQRRDMGGSEAYLYYLRGQQFLKKIDLPDIRRARKSFRASIKESPQFAAAMSGLARTDHLEWLLTARGDDALLQSAESHALKAIATEDEPSAGYRELGVIRLFQSRFDDSIDAFDRAEQHAPSHADLIADYADTLIHASDPMRGLQKIERAIQLNPLPPDVYWWTAAGGNYCLERYAKALECIARMAEPVHASRLTAACWGMLGNAREAAAARSRTMAMYPDFQIETWLAIMPVREDWQREQYREGLRLAGFQ